VRDAKMKRPRQRCKAPPGPPVDHHGLEKSMTTRLLALVRKTRKTVTQLGLHVQLQLRG
jgi:hypothetical protein